MQYTDLTRKELQREYSRLTRKYTDFIRQPVELDLTTEDPLPGCANRRAVPTARWSCAAKQVSALTPSTTARCWRARSRRISAPTS